MNGNWGAIRADAQLLPAAPALCGIGPFGPGFGNDSFSYYLLPFCQWVEPSAMPVVQIREREEVSGFVVCPGCGTRIKSGRPHCLRCFALLPQPDVRSRPPIWESLDLSRSQLTALAVGTSVLVTALLAVIWTTAPARAYDEARPVASVTRAAAPRPATQPGEAAAPDRVEPPAAVAQQEIDQARPKELTPDVRASLEAARTSYETT